MFNVFSRGERGLSPRAFRRAQRAFVEGRAVRIGSVGGNELWKASNMVFERLPLRAGGEAYMFYRKA